MEVVYALVFASVSALFLFLFLCWFSLDIIHGVLVPGGVVVRRGRGRTCPEDVGAGAGDDVAFRVTTWKVS